MLLELLRTNKHLEDFRILFESGNHEDTGILGLCRPDYEFFRDFCQALPKSRIRTLGFSANACGISDLQELDDAIKRYGYFTRLYWHRQNTWMETQTCFQVQNATDLEAQRKNRLAAKITQNLNENLARLNAHVQSVKAEQSQTLLFSLGKNTQYQSHSHNQSPNESNGSQRKRKRQELKDGVSEKKEAEETMQDVSEQQPASSSSSSSSSSSLSASASVNASVNGTAAATDTAVTAHTAVANGSSRSIKSPTSAFKRFKSQ